MKRRTYTTKATEAPLPPPFVAFVVNLLGFENEK